MAAFVPCPALLSARTSSLSSSRTLAVGTEGQCKVLEGWEHAFPLGGGHLEDVILGLDILHSQGAMEEGCLCAPEGIKPGMEPLWIPPPWSRERGRAETEITTGTGRIHAISIECPAWQTTNSITMLGQQNFSAPSPGTLKIHQKC